MVTLVQVPGGITNGKGPGVALPPDRQALL